MTGAPAADRPDAALDAATQVAFRHGWEDELEVLQCSNNVVVRGGALVFKVSTDFDKAAREVGVAAHAAGRGGPVLRPLGEPAHEQGFAVSVWPYCQPGPAPRDPDRDAASALVELHAAMHGVPLTLPTLRDRFAASASSLDARVAASVVSEHDRRVLHRALRIVSAESAGTAVVHAEPHDRNRLIRDGATVYIDLEAVCTGPVEWDLAYLPDDPVATVWPDHDAELRSTLQLGVSACVAIACWRHVSARPGDEEMRWHAERHLSHVRHRLDGGGHPG